MIPVKNDIPKLNASEGDNGSKYCYRYPHAAITADCVIFGFTGKELKILLIERGNEPYLGYWALPGGFMRIDETIEQTAARELAEETNLKNVYLDQFRVFSRVERDPRERVVTVAFIALVRPTDYQLLAGDDAANAIWFNYDMLPPLAFDHREIICEAREYLKETLRLKPVAFELLNKQFTISELQTVYEVINRTSYDRRNFLRTALDSEVIVEVPTADSHVNNHRNPRLYTVNKEYVSSSGLDSSSSKDLLGATVCHAMKAEEEFRSQSNRKARQEERKAREEEPKAPTKGLFDFLRHLSSR